MSSRNRTIITAIGLAFLFASAAFAQSTRIDSGVISQVKFGFYFETRLQPATPPLDGFTTQTTQEEGVIHRVLLDRSRRTYAGYDFFVQTLAEPNTYQVTIRPIAMNPELAGRVLGANSSDWTQMRTPGWSMPAPQTIKGGEVLEFTLLNDRTTGQSVIDYVTVQEPAGPRDRGFNGPTPARTFSFAPGPARDFRTTDAEMTIQSPRLSINGKMDETTLRRYDEVSGQIVWIAAARKGRYLLSLLPRPELGFRKAGEIRGSSLTFIVGKDTFNLSAGHPIAPGQSAYTLYVLHEPDWKLTFPNADTSAFVMGSLDPATLSRK